MKIEFDPVKSQKNAIERKLPFDLVIEFDFAKSLVIEDARLPYGETRYVATGYLGERLHILCFTTITDGIRAISLRKANKRECTRYDKENAK